MSKAQGKFDFSVHQTYNNILLRVFFPIGYFVRGILLALRTYGLLNPSGDRIESAFVMNRFTHLI